MRVHVFVTMEGAGVVQCKNRREAFDVCKYDRLCPEGYASTSAGCDFCPPADDPGFVALRATILSVGGMAFLLLYILISWTPLFGGAHRCHSLWLLCQFACLCFQLSVAGTLGLTQTVMDNSMLPQSMISAIYLYYGTLSLFFSSLMPCAQPASKHCRLAS